MKSKEEIADQIEALRLMEGFLLELGDGFTDLAKHSAAQCEALMWVLSEDPIEL